MPRLKHPGAGVSVLLPEDLVLCSHGPWDARARVLADRPLWDPRVATDRLRAIWGQHANAIRAAAGRREPWVCQRLQFVDALTERRERRANPSPSGSSSISAGSGTS